MTDFAGQMVALRERCLERAREDVKGAGWPLGVPPIPHNILTVATWYSDFITGEDDGGLKLKMELNVG